MAIFHSIFGHAVSRFQMLNSVLFPDDSRAPSTTEYYGDNSSLLTPSDLAITEAHGLRVVGEIEAPLSQMYIQYRMDWEPNPTLVDSDGNPNRAITECPIYKILCLYQERGERYVLKNFRQTEYFKMFQPRRDVGHYIDWVKSERKEIHLTDRDIRRKVKKLAGTYELIKRMGYLGKGFSKRYITVLEAPYELLRFEKNLPREPYEIWGGHHRAACLAALGFQSARVVLLRLEDKSY